MYHIEKTRISLYLSKCKSATLQNNRDGELDYNVYAGGCNNRQLEKSFRFVITRKGRLGLKNNCLVVLHNVFGVGADGHVLFCFVLFCFFQIKSKLRGFIAFICPNKGANKSTLPKFSSHRF